MLLMSLLICYIYVLTACSGSYERNTCDDAEYKELTLNILLLHDYYRVFRRAESEMAQSLKNDGINFSIDISYYSRDDVEGLFNIHTRLQVMLMAGQGYDMFLWDFHPTRNYADNGFLTNFYTLIDQHPTINRSDFFENILEAYEHRGGLYAFPLTFGFEFIGINSILPQSVVDHFVWRDYITLYEIFQIYNYLQMEYGAEFNHLDQGNTGNLRHLGIILSIIANDFIDYDNRVSHLNSNSFINMLDCIGNAFDATALMGAWGSADPWPLQDYVFRASEAHAFINLNGMDSPLVAMFDTIDPLFLNYIPLVNTDGSLLIDPSMRLGRGSTWGKLCIPAVGNGELAWEFVQYLIPVVLEPHPDYHVLWLDSLAAPISRVHFRPFIESQLNNIIQNPNLIPFAGIYDNNNLEQTFEIAIDRLEALSKMPAAIIESGLPEGFFSGNALARFIMGYSTAEEAASELHNFTSLWLIE